MESALTSSNQVEIRNDVVKFQKIIADCKEKIRELQTQCAHNPRRVWKKLETDNYLYKVVGYRCEFCSFPLSLGGGDRCYVCNGQTKYDSYIPGQGGGEHVQKCTDCGRTSDSSYYGIYRQSIPRGDFINE